MDIMAPGEFLVLLHPLRFSRDLLADFHWVLTVRPSLQPSGAHIPTSFRYRSAQRSPLTPGEANGVARFSSPACSVEVDALDLLRGIS
jgi:hypothetical protein